MDTGYEPDKPNMQVHHHFRLIFPQKSGHPLSYTRFPFKLDGRAIIQCRVSSDTIIKDFDIFKYAPAILLTVFAAKILKGER
jgi:hypothetical protein